MRHLISLVLGVVLAPVIYVLAGVSNSKASDHVLLHKNDITTLGLAIGCIVAIKMIDVAFGSPGTAALKIAAIAYRPSVRS